MSTQFPFKKCARKWSCFQNLPVYQKSVPNTLKVHIYLYHWAVQAVFDDRTSFRAKGLRGTSWNRNFTSVFDDRTSFRAKGLRGTSWNRNFTSVFGDRTSFRAKGLRFVPSRCHCLCSRLQERNRKEGEGKRARGQEGKRARGQEGKRARGQEGKRRRCEMRRCEKMWEDVRRCEKMWEDVRRCEKMWEDVRRCEKMWEDEEKMGGWEDVKMRRCEDVKMKRCEDVKMWRWKDVKMRGCEDETMFTGPHYWKNPALRRSREKWQSMDCNLGSELIVTNYN